METGGGGGGGRGLAPTPRLRVGARDWLGDGGGGPVPANPGPQRGFSPTPPPHTPSPPHPHSASARGRLDAPPPHSGVFLFFEKSGRYARKFGKLCHLTHVCRPAPERAPVLCPKVCTLRQFGRVSDNLFFPGPVSPKDVPRRNVRFPGLACSGHTSLLCLRLTKQPT